MDKRLDFISQLEAAELGTTIDFKGFLITRSITKVADDVYEIDDCSDGWQTATVNKETIVKLVMGEKEWYNLDWK